MKKKLWIVALMSLLLTLALTYAFAETISLGAVGSVEGETWRIKCSCGYTRALGTTTKGATCVSTGTGTCECSSCGKTWTVTIASSSVYHGWNTNAYEAPTCTAVGHRGWQCKYCKIWQYAEEIPMIDHDYDYTYTTSVHEGKCSMCGGTVRGSHTLTYTNKGKTGHRKYCATCGYDETTPHVMETYVTDPNLITPTHHTKMCEYCNYADNEAHEMITYNWNEPEYHHTACRNCNYHYEPAHTWVSKTNGASNHTTTCSECGYSKGTSSHTWGSWSGAQMPGVGTGTGHTRYCTECREEDSGPCTYGPWVNTSPNGYLVHTRTCSVCKLSSTHIPTGGTATCNKPATCSICGLGYGEFDSDNHNWGKWESRDSAYHQRTCANCGDTVGGPHQLNYTNYGKNGHRRYCSVCNYDETTPHVMETYVEDPNFITTTHHTKHCEYCDYGYNEAHEMITYNWNEPEYHHTACRNCNYHYEPAHTWVSKSNGASNHTTTCSECGYSKGTSSHTWGPWEKTSNGHKRSCTQCGEVDSGTHTYGGYDKDSTSHERTCSVCSYKDSGKHTYGGYDKDSTSHVRTCSVCSYKDSGSHTYGNYSHDEASHSRTCEVCAYVDSGSHSYGSYSMTDSTSHSRACAVCGRTQSGPHTVGIWEQDDSTYHKRTCSASGCTYTDREVHTFGDWNPEPNDPTMEYRSCWICGEKAYRYVRSTPTPVPTETPAPAVTATPEPVVTATPEPVVTATPEPVVTATPEPVVTATPEPVATATPEPVVTATPAPVVTATPEPVVTATPEPVATATPEPADAPEYIGGCAHPNQVRVGYRAPTCVEPGWSGHMECPDCGFTWDGVCPLRELGHDWEIKVDETETSYIVTKTCRRCGDGVGTVYEKPLDPDPFKCNHTFVTVPGYPASCEETGLEDVEFCPLCGTNQGGDKIPATGHQNLVEIPAEPGKTAGLKCGDCGKILVHPQDVGAVNVNGIVVTPEKDQQIGQVENNVYTDNNGNVIGTIQPDGTIVDPNGNVVGSLEGDHILDGSGNHVGTIVDSFDPDGDNGKDDDEYAYVDGIVIDPATGEVIGEVDSNLYTDNDGNEVGVFQPDGTLVDPNGQIVGTLDGDKIYDNNGNHVGTIVDGVDEDKYNNVNGTVVTPDGDTVLGEVTNNDYTDNNGNDVGTFLPDGSLVDPNGNIIGSLEGDYIYDNDGNHVGTIVDTTKIPGSDDFDLEDYLDDYYTHVEGGDEIRPNIDEEQCVIGTEQDVNGEKVLISGAEDFAICPIDQYPLSQWIPVGNGTHVRICTCGTCNYSELGACVYFEVTVNGELNKVCPICGHFGEAQYAHILGVKVGVDGHLHELICREYAEPFGADACVVMNYLWKPVKIVDSFTACKSVKGALMNWGDQETLYIPMPNPGAVTLVRMDYAGVFTEVDYTWADGKLIFNADNHGLYLIVAE